MTIAFLLSINVWQAEGTSPDYRRWVTFIVPLAVALQSAFLLSPGDEPALEILLASPRSLPRILLERLSVVAVLQGSVALMGSLISLILPGTVSLWGVVAGWLAPCIFLGGVALWVAQLTRQGAFSALLTVMVWGAMLLGGDKMVAHWPALWPIHLFLRPDNVPILLYVFNRIILILVGLAFMARAARYMRNEEHMLGIRSVTGRRR
jgi:hypothetical protein